ncbi:unnamed protein product, partial [marine sediment metagenome]
MGGFQTPSPRGIDISDANATVDDVKSPKTFYAVAAPRKTGTMPTVALAPASDAYPAGYHAGNVGGLPAIDADLIAAYIKYGITVFGIPGTMVQWIYDLSFPELAKLVIPTPSLALVVAEDHSGGANPATPPALSIPTPTVGKATAVTGVNAVG